MVEASQSTDVEMIANNLHGISLEKSKTIIKRTSFADDTYKKVNHQEEFVEKSSAKTAWENWNNNTQDTRNNTKVNKDIINRAPIARRAPTWDKTTRFQLRMRIFLTNTKITLKEKLSVLNNFYFCFAKKKKKIRKRKVFCLSYLHHTTKFT